MRPFVDVVLFRVRCVPGSARRIPPAIWPPGWRRWRRSSGPAAVVPPLARH